MAAFSYQFHHNNLQSSHSFHLEPTGFKINHNEHSKTHTESSSVTDKLESGEQVTQHVPPMDSSKRKSKEGPGPKGRKQRKCSKSMNDSEEKKAKEERKKQKRNDQDQPPTGYIHVRARRGQATDSHSLAERVRREKISERMKVLQELVPGCDKVTGKALMLDEIINYVQSLQNQVEFLSMKLASLNPLFYDYGMDLDCLLVRPDQILSSNIASPAQQNLHQCDEAIISDTAQLLSSSSLLFPQAHHHHHHHHHNNQTQGNGQLFWDVDEQRQKQVINNDQTGFTNNLGSFH